MAIKSGYDRLDLSNIPQGPPSEPQEKYNLTEGFRSDLSPQEMSLGATPSLDLVRFEDSGIRKDFGYRALGSVAAQRVRALGEHKFIDEGLTFHRFVRLTRTAAYKLKIEVWDGSSWVDTSTSTDDVDDLPLFSMLSIQGSLVIAVGNDILRWFETISTIAHSEDFSGTALDAVNETDAVAISPIAVDDSYTIRYKVRIYHSKAETIAVTVGFLANGVQFDTNDHSAVASAVEDSFTDITGQTSVFNGVLADGQELAIKFVSQSGEHDYLFSGTNIQQTATKDQAHLPSNNQYRIVFEATPGGSDGEVALEVDTGGGYVTLDTWQVPASGGVVNVSESYTVLSAGDNTVFRLTATSLTPPDAPPTISPGATLKWDGLIEVTGYVDATDSDPGVSWNGAGSPVASLATLSVDAPDARYIGEFARRVVALWDAGDSQVVSWCADGTITDWTGSGSGSVTLVESGIDAINPLRAIVKIGDNLAALFRDTSIWRVFETGNTAQALGFVSWIEGVGTKCPHSVQVVPGGALFVGQDMMVYWLTQGGVQAVGLPIKQELITHLISNLERVDSAYDSIFGEYWLTVPEDGAAHGTVAWILDFSTVMQGGPPRWRRRVGTFERVATVSEV